MRSGRDRGGGARDFDELAGTDVVEIAVDRDGFWDERVILDTADIVEDRLLLILDGQPVDILAFAGAGTFAQSSRELKDPRH